MDNFWKLEEQNTFATGVQSTKILYHSNLNILLIVTKNGEIVVVDVTTGAELHKSLLTGNFHDIFYENVNIIIAEIVHCFRQIWTFIPDSKILKNLSHAFFSKGKTGLQRSSASYTIIKLL